MGVRLCLFHIDNISAKKSASHFGGREGGKIKSGLSVAIGSDPLGYVDLLAVCCLGADLLTLEEHITQSKQQDGDCYHTSQLWPHQQNALSQG